jgi:antirestriction protein ArdC
MAYYKRSTNSDGQTAESKALDKFAELMIAKIKDIQTDWHKPWFTEGMMKWPKNLSGREYNGMNALGLMLHCENNGYQTPVFCTFNRVVGLNYDSNKKPLTDENGEKLPSVGVNKGEKAFPVMLTSFTVVNKDTREKIPYDDYKKLSEEEKKDYNVYPKLNVYQVFNIDQTNMKEARPELYAKIVEQNEMKRPEGMHGENFSFPAMDEMIKHDLWHCPIKLVHQDQAYYSPSKDEIVVPEKSQFIDGESFYGTLWHEMSHSTGAESRLNRLKPSSFGNSDYAREELVAELSAALIGSRYGVEKNVKSDSAAYLKAWLDNLQESPDFIKTTLQDVKKATSMVSHRIDLVQGQISAHQAKVGSEESYPDIYDIDNDGNTNEVVHVKHLKEQEEPEEEYAFRRGR